MRTFIVFIMLSVFTQLSWGQDLRAVDDAQKDKMFETITQASASMKTMQCDFKQTKNLSFLDDKMVSTGKMYYKQDNLLRWEYTSPYSYIFILNGTTVIMQSSQKKEIIDTKSSRLFQEIAKIMMNSITGKNLSTNKDFKVALYTKGDKWVAELTPLKKEMKQMFSTIVLYFNPAQSTVYRVELLEKTGDSTHIELNDIRLNVVVDEKVFDFK